MTSRARIRANAPSERTRGRPRSEETHTALLDAGIALTREVGYDAVTIEAIAARAGAGKATVYRRWASKELLITEAITRMVRTVAVPDTGSVDGDVYALMRVTMGMYQDPATGPLLSGLIATMDRNARVADAVRSGFVRVWRDAMRIVLRRASARGELRDDLDEELTLDLLSGALFYRYLMLGKAIEPEFTRDVVTTVLRGIAPEPGAKTKRSTRRRPSQR